MNKTKNLAIISGASGDIGQEIAQEFAKEGVNLLLIAHNNLERLENFKKDSQLFDIDINIVSLDLANPQEINSKIKPILECGYDLKFLINCAGISHIGLLQDMSDLQWENIMNTNMSSVFYLSRLAIPYFLENKEGTIINISSIWGSIGASCEVAYSASKGALNSFTKALAKELAPSNISVNALSCGMIDTKMNSCFSQDEIENICDEIPAGRMASPEEVAKAVLLLSKMPSYLTGQIIGIDGGWL